ncbi:hypothetical protein RHGRI_030955 [Rhododendron griersonianum]|uniref:Uncharacterized protein n=1 Tax=Rhododendron griersonianum TaxID=479676 RepID=A0AAV6I6H8_9ERIC|nr:hypothetical protein RHGRI_030955 [Rhododendron griersonianum]
MLACLPASSGRLEVLWRLCNLRLEFLLSSKGIHVLSFDRSFDFRGMARFKSFQEGSMTILNDSTDKVENGTTLTVHPAFLGAWALQYEPLGDVLHPPQWAIETSCEVIGSKSDSLALLLQSAHHDEEQPTPFSLLGHRIQTEEAV